MKRRILAALAVLTFTFAAAPVARAVDYNIRPDICNGINPDTKDCSDNNKVPGILKATVNVLSLVIGALSTLMIVVAGFRYLVSSGEQAAVKSAKDTILYAVIGLVIALMAQALLRFVFTKAT